MSAPISFSIVLEDNTVTPVTIDSLMRCLASLASQELSPAAANEVVLMDAGGLDVAARDRIQASYPWVIFKQVPVGTRYFETKVAGIPATSGEVIVFCDADNRYRPGWLDGMVRPFSEDPQLEILVGQTSVEITGVLSTAFALTFFFPPFVGSKQGLGDAESYFGNNMSFRRTFLDSNPIPVGLPLLRGNDYVHSVWVRRGGHKVRRQFGARALHDAPETLAELLLRYLARGSDRLEIARLTREGSEGRKGPLAFGAMLGATRLILENIGEFLGRIVQVARGSPRALIYYPVAIPLGVALLSLTLFGLGYSVVRPNVLVGKYLAHQYRHLAPIS